MYSGYSCEWWWLQVVNICLQNVKTCSWVFYLSRLYSFSLCGTGWSLLFTGTRRGRKWEIGFRSMIKIFHLLHGSWGSCWRSFSQEVSIFLPSVVQRLSSSSKSISLFSGDLQFCQHKESCGQRDRERELTIDRIYRDREMAHLLVWPLQTFLLLSFTLNPLIVLDNFCNIFHNFKIIMVQ